MKKILIALAAIIAIFLIVVALQASEFKVERSATIAAQPAATAMRANGVEERLCTGDADPLEKYLAWARTVPATLRLTI